MSGSLRAGPTVLALAAAAESLVPLAWRAPTLLLWNASASLPRGLYALRRSEPIRRGDTVAAWAPDAARRLAAARRYIPASVPLLKQVAAAAGDRVCVSAPQVSVNGRRVALVRARDPSGRSLPRFTGCRRLSSGEYLLLGHGPLSFDGRYFGPVGKDALIGRAILLWPR